MRAVGGAGGKPKDGVGNGLGERGGSNQERPEREDWMVSARVFERLEKRRKVTSNPSGAAGMFGMSAMEPVENREQDDRNEEGHQDGGHG
jgi:hypothetical protein